jgi:hypothetical protein
MVDAALKLKKITGLRISELAVLAASDHFDWRPR